MRRIRLVAVLMLVAACDSYQPPAAPSPSDSPSPVIPGRYEVSGIVLEEGGGPMADTRVNVQYPRGGSFSSPASICSDFGGCGISINTDAAGSYQFVFEPGNQRFYGTDVAGVLSSWREGYESNVQLLPRGSTRTVVNLRLRRTKRITAGDSFTVLVEPDSSMCTDTEDWFVWTHRCGSAVITPQSTGTLVVDARDGTGGGPLPFIFFATSGNYTTLQTPGTGVASVGVRAGERYYVFVGAPVGVPAQRYEVTTSVR
jgi:hypothetical protein